jgi:hypothetical protein
MINETIAPARARRAKALAEMARERIFRSFTNADNEAPATAKVPFEFARAEDCSRPEEREGNEKATALDLIIGALLFSFFSSGRGETVREATQQSENE